VPAAIQILPFHHFRVLLSLESMTKVPGEGFEGNVLGEIHIPPLTLVGANEAGVELVTVVDNPNVCSSVFPEPSFASISEMRVMGLPN